jgi:hypothetical protein
MISIAEIPFLLNFRILRNSYSFFCFKASFGQFGPQNLDLYFNLDKGFAKSENCIDDDGEKND